MLTRDTTHAATCHGLSRGTYQFLTLDSAQQGNCMRMLALYSFFSRAEFNEYKKDNDCRDLRFKVNMDSM